MKGKVKTLIKELLKFQQTKRKFTNVLKSIILII